MKCISCDIYKLAWPDPHSQVTRKELGDYYKTFMRMTAQEAFEAFMDISGVPDDRPYEEPFYWAAFTYNGSSI